MTAAHTDPATTRSVFWVSHPASGPPRHLKGLRDVPVVETSVLALVSNAVTLATRVGGIVNISGGIGRGKTFATWEALRDVDRRVITLDVEDSLRSKGFVERIEQATTRRQLNSRDPERVILDNLCSHLSMAPSVIVIDEVQNLATSPLRLIKYLHDRPEGLDTGIVLVGFDPNVFNKAPELADRLVASFEVPPIAEAEIRAVMDEYSPYFANSDNQTIKALFKAHGGHWRRWANIVRVAQSLDLDPTKGLHDKQLQTLLAMTKKPRTSKQSAA